MSYVFLQCLNEQCRFRFPAPAAEAKALLCPRCRGLLTIAFEIPAEKPANGILPPITSHLVGLLDNIRSIHNVGSMFRSADGANVTHLYLAGITATPHHPKLAKAALGAHETISWTYFLNNLDAVADLRAKGYQLWALERPIALKSPPANLSTALPGKIALVVGNERAGIDPAILDQCDAVFSLPMAGHKSSLNAAVAFGIALYLIRYGRTLLTGQ